MVVLEISGFAVRKLSLDLSIAVTAPLGVGSGKAAAVKAVVVAAPQNAVVHVAVAEAGLCQPTFERLGLCTVRAQSLQELHFRRHPLHQKAPDGEVGTATEEVPLVLVERLLVLLEVRLLDVCIGKGHSRPRPGCHQLETGGGLRGASVDLRDGGCPGGGGGAPL